MLGRLKRATTRTLDKLFLRPAIRETKQNVDLLAKRLERVEAADNLNVMLLSTKIDYIVARLDALADIDDQIGAEQRAHVEQLTQLSRQSVEAQTSMRADIDALRQELKLAATTAAESSRRLDEVRTNVDGVRNKVEQVCENVKVFAADQLSVNRKADTFHASAITQIEKIGRTHDTSRQDISKAISAINTRIDRATDRTVRDLTRTAFNEFRQQEALGALRALMSGVDTLTGTRGWAGSPDFLLYLYRHIAANRPGAIVELGSGVSTLVAAAALAANGEGGVVHSLDHDPGYATKTRELLARHGLEQYARVHEAPLKAWEPLTTSELGNDWQWYTVPDEVASLSDIALLVVDGPPASSGQHARYPAVPQFRAQMSVESFVLLDDAQREEEQAIANAWSTEFGLTLDLRLNRERDFEKGLAILRTQPESVSG